MVYDKRIIIELKGVCFMVKKVIILLFILGTVIAVSTGFILGGNVVLSEWLEIKGTSLTILQYLLIACVIFPAKFFISATRDILFEVN